MSAFLCSQSQRLSVLSTSKTCAVRAAKPSLVRQQPCLSSTKARFRGCVHQRSQHTEAEKGTHRRPLSNKTAEEEEDSWLSLLDAEVPSLHQKSSAQQQTATSTASINHGATPNNSGKSWTAISEQHGLQRATQRIQLRKIFNDIVHEDAHFKDAVLIAIDCEASPYSQFYGKLTKLGVSVLDTGQLRSESDTKFDPRTWGNDAITSPWLPLTTTAHYAIADTTRFRFRTRREQHTREDLQRTVGGCRFGPSTWIRSADVAQILHRIFANPAMLEHASDFSTDIPETKRNIVLVGHGLLSDINYMKQIHASPAASARIVASFDTSVMLSNSLARSLEDLLANFGISTDRKVRMHVAGNDAINTLTLFLLMVALDTKQPDRFASLMRLGAEPRKILELSTQVSNWSIGGTATSQDVNLVVEEFNKSVLRTPSRYTGPQ